jgi:16S rRNA processing protein RimM
VLENEYILMARVIAAHGICGEVKLKSFMSDAAEIFKFSCVYDEEGNKIGKLTKKSITTKFVIATIAGITNRNEAELLKGKNFYIKSSQLTKLDYQDEFYHKDLLKLKVMNIKLQHVAQVVALYNFGAGDILEVLKLDNTLEMVMFNKKNVPIINLDRGYLVIDFPEIV